MANLKLLLVDDEKQFVSALAERLSLRGLDADWATTGQEAIDKARQTTYDLAILDVKMPQLGGVELKRELERVTPDTRFIFFTGHGSEDEFKACSAEGSCYLVKPLRIEELMEKIQETMTDAPPGG